MVLCLLALPIFAILGIFSAKYRKLTKDALACLFKTVTLRKCDVGLDSRIKSAITGKILRFSPKLARLVYLHYKVFSFFIFILFVWASVESGIGIYNLAVYGNCNGPGDEGFCVFDPASGVSQSKGCPVIPPTPIGEGVAPELEDDDPFVGNPDASFTFIEFGCYSCPFTQKAEATVEEIMDYYEGEVNYQFKTFYIPNHPYSFEAAVAATCAFNQGTYKAYHDALFAHEGDFYPELFDEFAERLDLDMAEFTSCIASNKTKEEVNSDQEQGLLAGVQGTPTFFIGDEYIVGNKPVKTFKKVIDRQKNE